MVALHVTTVTVASGQNRTKSMASPMIKPAQTAPAHLNRLATEHLQYRSQGRVKIASPGIKAVGMRSNSRHRRCEAQNPKMNTEDTAVALLHDDAEQESKLQHALRTDAATSLEWISQAPSENRSSKVSAQRRFSPTTIHILLSIALAEAILPRGHRITIDLGTVAC